MKDLLTELIQLADQLDKAGNIQIANEIDNISQKVKTSLVSEAVYSDDPSDPRGRAEFFIDRAINRLENAQNDIFNASKALGMDDEARAAWPIDDLRIVIDNVKAKLERWINKLPPISPGESAEAFRILEGSFENAELRKLAVIRRMKGKWCVLSKKGKKLGCYTTKKDALKRLRQIEFFKHNK